MKHIYSLSRRHPQWVFRFNRELLFLALGLMFFAGTRAFAATDTIAKNTVFDGPIAVYEEVPPLVVDKTAPPDVLRWVWVEERMNVARRNAPVRVPVFFAAGECVQPEQLALVRWPSRQEMVSQNDDVRRGPDGGVARLHMWFNLDLNAGESVCFALIRRAPAGIKRTNPIEVESLDGRLRLSAGGTAVSFFEDSVRQGRLASLGLNDGPVLEFSEGAQPNVLWSDEGSDNGLDKSDDHALFAWAVGPVFAKVDVQTHDGKGGIVKQVFRLFDDGSFNLIQTINPSAATDGLTLSAQDFTSGELRHASGLSVRPQSAGIVDSLVGVHPGYAVDALIRGNEPRGFLVVPGTLGGVAGRISLDDSGQFNLHAPGELKPASGDARAGTVRALWSEVTFIPAQREGDQLDRRTLLTASQPLVAVVERPGVTLATATAGLLENVLEIKPVGWVNESVVRFLQGKASPFPRRKWGPEADPANWVAQAQHEYAKVTGNSGRVPEEDEKGRAAGSLDPYHITYESTPLAYWLLKDALPEPVHASLRARMEAVRRQLGRVDEQGWPYLDVFFRTQNMQMGPPFLTLADPDAAPDLKRYFRDQLSAPTLSAVMLRGLRPYEGSPQTTPAESDTLYQAVVDFYLRASELALNESLGLQPVSFGRYLDAVDVNADLYHPAHPRAEDEGGRFARANFFRTQSHLHRWLAWGPAPFIALLRAPLKGTASFPGATEAWQFANVLKGRWKNWPDQSWLFLAAMLSEKNGGYSPSPRPVAPETVVVKHTDNGNRINWENRSGVVCYRIYRLRHDSSPVWLNSPYRHAHASDAGVTAWLDEEGKPDDVYLVHAVNQAGQESAW